MQVGKPRELEVDMVIGADGANSRVAKEIGAGDYDYAIAFQARPCGFSPLCLDAKTSAFAVVASTAWSQLSALGCAPQPCMLLAVVWHMCCSQCNAGGLLSAAVACAHHNAPADTPACRAAGADQDR